MNQTICDKCGKTTKQMSGYNKPVDWERIEVRVGYGTKGYKEFDLCRVCADRLGFVREIKDETTEKKVMELLCELI